MPPSKLANLGKCPHCDTLITNDGGVAVRFLFRKDAETGDEMPDGIEFYHQGCVGERWRWSSHEEFEKNEDADASDELSEHDGQQEGEEIFEERFSEEWEFFLTKLEQHFRVKQVIADLESDLEAQKLGKEDEEIVREIVRLTASIEQNKRFLNEIELTIRHASFWIEKLIDSRDEIDELYDFGASDWLPLERSIAKKANALDRIAEDEKALVELIDQGKGNTHAAERLKSSLAELKRELALAQEHIEMERLSMVE